MSGSLFNLLIIKNQLIHIVFSVRFKTRIPKYTFQVWSGCLWSLFSSVCFAWSGDGIDGEVNLRLSMLN